MQLKKVRWIDYFRGAHYGTFFAVNELKSYAMRTPFFYSIFLLLTCFSFGQELPFELDWSPIDTVKKSESVRGLMLANDKGAFALTEHMSAVGRVQEYGIVRYDNALQPVRRSTFDPVHEEHRLKFEFSEELSGVLYLFFSSREHSGNTRRLWAARLNYETLDLTDFKEVIHIQNEGLHAMESIFMPAISKNHEHLAIYYQLQSGLSVKQRVRIKVFGSGLNEKRTLDKELDIRGWLFFPKKLMINDAAEVALFSKKYHGERKESAWGKANYHYELMTNTNADPYELHKIMGEDDSYLKIGAEFDKDGAVICSGFYAERNALDIRGTYFMRYNISSSKVMSVQRTVIPKEFLLKNVSALKAETIRLNISSGSKKELKNYRFHAVNYNSVNNGVVVTAEYFTEEGSESTLMVTSTSYKDLISVSLDQMGKPIWYAKVPKKQNSILDDGRFASVLSWTYNGELFLAYNENPNNLDGDEYKRVRNFNAKRDAAFIIARVNGEGVVKKQLVGCSNLTLVNGLPKLARAVKPGVYMVPCRKGKFMRLAKLEF